jgi:hypothetical protein
MHDLDIRLEDVQDIAVIPGSNHVWVVGDAGKAQQPFAEYFGGKHWTRVPVPKVANGWGYLDWVVATSAHNAWAIGTAYSGPNDTESSLVVHWGRSGMDARRATRTTRSRPGHHRRHIRARYHRTVGGRRHRQLPQTVDDANASPRLR